MSATPQQQTLEEIRDQLRDLPERLASQLRRGGGGATGGSSGGGGGGRPHGAGANDAHGGQDGPRSAFDMTTGMMDAFGFRDLARAFREGQQRIGTLRSLFEDKQRQGLSLPRMLGSAAGDY